MTTSGEEEFAVRLLEEQIIEDIMSPESAYLYTYGLYLSHGGDPAKFEDMTDTDVQLMYTVHEAAYKRMIKDIIAGMAKVYTKMFGVDE